MSQCNGRRGFQSILGPLYIVPLACADNILILCVGQKPGIFKMPGFFDWPRFSKLHASVSAFRNRY